jgi:sortase A
MTTRDSSAAPGASAEAAPAAASRSTRRRWLRRLSWVFFAIAILLLIEGALVLTWKEPITSYLQSRSQSALSAELRERLDAPEAARELSAIPDGAGPAARALLADLEIGDAVARVEIPAIGVSQAVIQGTDSTRLRRGPGHYPETSLPGLGRTTAIAGHRTTWGAPFRNLDDLDPGDLVLVRLPYGTARFRVIDTRVVDDQDFSILTDVGRERLVLTACHPLYSASQRLAVFAELEGARVPPGAVANLPGRRL